ncbi:PKD domain-containing protein [Dokdonella sp.]|uniref:PKD domain-containing protein n=1 Tax=Dokdonella sp. TaxID=2291710 RepID=UPI0025C3E1E5|nr:PKD domain-containing protein [Dokdonella sp.]
MNDLLVNMGDSAEHSVPFAQLGLAFLGEVAKGTSQASGPDFAHGFEALPNQPPTASFSSLANGLDVSFTNTSTDNDGSIVSHAWNFGDGGNSTVANPQHSYAVGGGYQVTLTVTDDDGASDDRVRNVVVSPGGGPLQNGVPVAGLSDTQGGTIYFTLEVPRVRPISVSAAAVARATWICMFAGVRHPPNRFTIADPLHPAARKPASLPRRRRNLACDAVRVVQLQRRHVGRSVQPPERCRSLGE